MSIKVVTNSHWSGDETKEVPSMEDLKGIINAVNEIKSSLKDYVMESSLKTKENVINNQLNDLESLINHRLLALYKTLQSGDWKQIFKGEVEDILRALDEKYTILGEEVDKRKNELTAMLLSEQEMAQLIQSHEIRIKEMLDVYVKQFVESVREKNAKEIQNYLCKLIESSKNITWK